MSGANSLTQLSEHLFWDINMDDLDFESFPEFIIH